MRKKVLFLAVLFVLCVVSEGLAIDFQAYAKLGTISFKENNTDEGNKFLTGFGVKATIGDKFKKTISAEMWRIEEPQDEDVELPHNGYHFSAEGSYCFYRNNFTFYPFAGVSFDRWERNENSKYQNSFSRLNYASANFGVGAKYNIFCVRIGGVLPVWSQADHNINPGARLGINATVGVEWQRYFVSLFYQYQPMGGDKQQADFQLNRRGVMLGIKF